MAGEPHTIDSLFELFTQFNESNLTLQGEVQSLREEVARLTSLVRAFPHKDGQPDLAGHREDHETRIQEAKTSAERWEAIQTDIWKTVAKGFLYGTILLILLGVQGWVSSLIKAVLASGG